VNQNIRTRSDSGLTSTGGLGFFLSLAVLLIVLGMLPQSGLTALIYARTRVGEGEFWRLITASFVHPDWTHLVWNLVGLAVVAAIVSRCFGYIGWIVVTLSSAGVTGLGLYWFSPATLSMAGLSAVLHGLVSSAAVAQLWRGDRLAGSGLTLLVAAKLIWEQLYGAPPWVGPTVGGAVAIDAHLHGAIGGLLAGLAMAAAQERRGQAAD